MRNSRQFENPNDQNNQTDLNAYLTKEQIEQLQEDGISVSESELARLHQEVLNEQGIAFDESIDQEARLFGTKNKTNLSGKNTISTSANTKSNIGKLGDSRNNTKNKQMNSNANNNVNLNQNINKPNVGKKKFT